jgi:hypothetical protein
MAALVLGNNFNAMEEDRFKIGTTTGLIGPATSLT